MGKQRVRMTRVFIISDVPLYRMGLAQVLMLDGRLRVVGTAGGWADGLRAMHVLHAGPDALLVDLGLPQGVGEVRTLASAFREIPVVALTSSEDEQTVIPSTEAGGFGVLSRCASLDELVQAVESVADGETLGTPRVTAALLRCVARRGERPSEGPSAPRLTLREREIMGLIDQGLSNKEIAGQLRIELPTVKNHVHHILRKLNASCRGEAAAMLRGDRPRPGLPA